MLLLALAAAAQDSPRVHPASLDRVVQAYGKVQGFELVADVTNRRTDGAGAQDAPSPGPEQETLAVAYSAPDLWWLRHSLSGMSHVFRDKREYMVGENGRGGFSQADPKRYGSAFASIGFVAYTELKDDLSSARAVRQEEVVLAGVGIPCTVIQADYAAHDKAWSAVHWPGGQHSEFRLKRRTLWVDNQRFVVLREVDLVDSDFWSRQSQFRQHVLFEHTITVEEFEWDQRPPESRFVVGPPSGTVLADGSVTPGPRGFGSLMPVVDGCQKIADPWSRKVCLQKTQNECVRHLPISAEVRAAKLDGGISVAFSIDPEGATTGIQVKEGLGLGLDEEVVACIAQYRFLPPEKGGAKKALVTYGNIGVDSDSFWHRGIGNAAESRHDCAGGVGLRSRHLQLAGQRHPREVHCELHGRRRICRLNHRYHLPITRNDADDHTRKTPHRGADVGTRGVRQSGGGFAPGRRLAIHATQPLERRREWPAGRHGGLGLHRQLDFNQRRLDLVHRQQPRFRCPGRERDEPERVGSLYRLYRASGRSRRFRRRPQR
jgi:hypothetical protein